MGQVIPWPKPENRSPRPARDTNGPGGRIILFLGVRYERHDEAAGLVSEPRAARARSERPQRRRKRV
jgi:hypothetical protein